MFQLYWMPRREELLNVPTTVHVPAWITAHVVALRFQVNVKLNMAVVPEFAAVLNRVAVTVKMAQPSAKKVIAQKLQQADVYK